MKNRSDKRLLSTKLALVLELAQFKIFGTSELSSEPAHVSSSCEWICCNQSCDQHNAQRGGPAISWFQLGTEFSLFLVEMLRIVESQEGAVPCRS